MTGSKVPASLIVAIVLLTSFSAWRQAPDLSSDAATCLLASAQHATGESPRAHTLVDVDPGDLKANRRTYLAWWPASYEALPAAFRKLGWSWGNSIRATFFVVWLCGCLGWFLYFRSTAPGWLLPWLMVFFLLFRYSHNNASIYDGGEFLFWGAFPWVLMLNLTAIRHSGTRIWLAALAGMVTPLLTLVKFSAGLSILGFGAAWLWLATRGAKSTRDGSRKMRVSWNSFSVWCAAGLLVSFTLIKAGVVGGANPATVRDDWHFMPFVWIWEGWLLAISDLEILLMKLMVHRDSPMLTPLGQYQDGHLTWLVPLAIGCWLWFARCNRGARERSNDDRTGDTASFVVAVVHLIIFSAGLAGLMANGGKIHMDARFLRPAAIALLPFVASAVVSAVRATTLPRRASGIVAATLLFVIPALYGAATLSYKTFIRPSRVAGTVGPEGVRHELLDGSGDATGFVAEIRSMCKRDSVLYLIDHGMALNFVEQRLTIEHAQARTVEHLSRRRFRGRPGDGVVLVVPRTMATNGKLQAIQSSFIDLKEWRVVPSRHQPNWLLVRGT